MRDSINLALIKYIGQSVNWNGEDLHIERFKEISTGKICVYTHKGPKHFLESEIEEKFIDCLTEPKSLDFRDRDIMHSNTRALQGYTPSAENVELKANLMEMLSKVKQNPGYIPQAKAVCDIANTMVNLQKTELDMIKMVTGQKA